MIIMTLIHFQWAYLSKPGLEMIGKHMSVQAEVHVHVDVGHRTPAGECSEQNQSCNIIQA